MFQLSVFLNSNCCHLWEEWGDTCRGMEGEGQEHNLAYSVAGRDTFSWVAAASPAVPRASPAAVAAVEVLPFSLSLCPLVGAQPASMSLRLTAGATKQLTIVISNVSATRCRQGRAEGEGGGLYKRGSSFYCVTSFSCRFKFAGGSSGGHFQLLVANSCPLFLPPTLPLSLSL